MPGVLVWTQLNAEAFFALALSFFFSFSFYSSLPSPPSLVLKSYPEKTQSFLLNVTWGALRVLVLWLGQLCSGSSAPAVRLPVRQLPART